MEGEHFNQYVANLRLLIKTCGYCADCEPTMLRDRIILGIRDDDIREELLKESKLTLEKCLDICTAGEAAAEHRRSLQSDKVQKVKSEDKRPRRGKCRYCAQEHVFRKEECPAWGKRCTICKKRNHLYICCQSKESQSEQTKKRSHRTKRDKVHKVHEDSSSYETEESSDE